MTSKYHARAASAGMSESSLVSLCRWATKEHKLASKPVGSAYHDTKCPPLDLNQPIPAWFKGIKPILIGVCRDCGMYENGGVTTICKACPMVDFVKQLSVSTETAGAK